MPRDGKYYSREKVRCLRLIRVAFWCFWSTILVHVPSWLSLNTNATGTYHALVYDIMNEWVYSVLSLCLWRRVVSFEKLLNLCSWTWKSYTVITKFSLFSKLSFAVWYDVLTAGQLCCKVYSFLVNFSSKIFSSLGFHQSGASTFLLEFIIRYMKYTQIPHN